MADRQQLINAMLAGVKVPEGYEQPPAREPWARKYLPDWAADWLGQSIGPASMAFGARAAGPIMGRAAFRTGSVPLPPPELNASSMAGEAGVRPSGAPLPYPRPQALSRMVGSQAANSNASPEGAPFGSDPHFESWAMKFLEEFNAEQAAKLAHIRKPELTLIPGGKTD